MEFKVGYLWDTFAPPSLHVKEGNRLREHLVPVNVFGKYRINCRSVAYTVKLRFGFLHSWLWRLEEHSAEMYRNLVKQLSILASFFPLVPFQPIDIHLFPFPVNQFWIPRKQVLRYQISSFVIQPLSAGQPVQLIYFFFFENSLMYQYPIL